jgi:hypothetical protein
MSHASRHCSCHHPSARTRDDAEIIEFLGEKDRTSRFQTLLRNITGRFLPRHFNPIWKYLYYSNVAVLCRQAQSNRS